MNAALLSKIKALLRLARDKSATMHEAALAMQRAHDLMEKHRIDVATLDLDAATEELLQRFVPGGHRVSRIKQVVLGILKNHFRVDVCIAGSRGISISGFESDVTVALYVFEFLCRALSRGVDEYEAQERRSRRRFSVNKYRNYIAGWGYALHDKLRKEPAKAVDDSRFAIVLASQDAARKAYFEALFPETKKKEQLHPGRKNVSALTAGFLAGERTSLRDPLQNANGGPLLLKGAA